MKQVGHLGTGIHKLLKAVILTEINIPIFVPYLLHEVFCPAPLFPNATPASQHPVCNLDGLRESYGHLRGGISESVNMI